MVPRVAAWSSVIESGALVFAWWICGRDEMVVSSASLSLLSPLGSSLSY